MENNMNQVRSDYKEFYNDIKYRTNIFEWYPFKKDAKILYVGDSSILISYFLQCIQTDLFNLNTINQQFDYIIVDGELDHVEDKESVLHDLLNKRNSKDN